MLLVALQLSRLHVKVMSYLILQKGVSTTHTPLSTIQFQGRQTSTCIHTKTACEAISSNNSYIIMKWAYQTTRLITIPWVYMLNQSTMLNIMYSQTSLSSPMVRYHSLWSHSIRQTFKYRTQVHCVLLHCHWLHLFKQ